MFVCGGGLGEANTMMKPITKLIYDALRNRSRTNVRTLLNDALRVNNDPSVEEELLQMLSLLDTDKRSVMSALEQMGFRLADKKNRNNNQIMLSEANYKAFDKESEDDFLIFNYHLTHLFEDILNRYPNLSIPKLLQVADAMSGGKVDIKDYLAVLRLLPPNQLKEIFENSAFVVSEDNIVKEISSGAVRD